MYLSKEIYNKLQYFSTPEGEQRLKTLADVLWEHSTRAMVTADSTNSVLEYKGAANLALLLKDLSKNLRDFNAGLSSLST